MDCRKYLGVLLMVAAISCKDIRGSERSGTDNGVTEDSMVEVVQRLVRDVTTLKTDNQQLKTDNQQLKVDNQNLKKDNTELKNEVAHLNNNGHSKFSVADQQWQSIHMAAAAACRASTALGGHGPWGNTVYPRTKGHNCDQVCNTTKVYTQCDAALSIMGFMGQMKASNKPVGLFYNYHCNGLKYDGREAEADVTNYAGYLGYCCCRKP